MNNGQTAITLKVLLAAVCAFLAAFISGPSIAAATPSPFSAKQLGPERPPIDSQGPAADEPASGKATIVPGHYIVVLEDSVEHPGAVAEAQTEQRDGELGFVYRHALNGYSAADLSRADVEALRGDPRVRYVTPDHRVEAFEQSIPAGISRTLATTNPSLDIDNTDDVRINADVAVIDSGIDYEHPDLDVEARTNCVSVAEFGAFESCVDNSGSDGNTHGTHVAGTIGAIDNGEGVVGDAPGARLWAVRVLNNRGSGEESWIVAGIDWVTAHASEIEVANMSLGCQCTAPAFDTAINKSVEAGVVYVVAAGNNAINASGFSPANNANVITVSALADYDGMSGGEGWHICGNGGEDDHLASFSNYGSTIEIAAPGVCTYSTEPGGKYGYKSGTSMASPHVAGAAALLASKSNPNSKKDVEAIRQQLISEGNKEWTDTAPDGVQEPLLDLGRIATKPATIESESKATLRGKVKPDGLATTYRFEYGKTTSYGTKVPIPDQSIGSGSAYVDVSQAISGLSAKTAYHFRVAATNSGGTFYSADREFGTTKPVVTTDAASEVHGNDAVLNATINPNGPAATYRFEYGKTTSYGTTVTLKGLSPETTGVTASRAIGGLAPNRTYHFRVLATNSAGTVEGKDQSFATASPEWRTMPTPNPPENGYRRLENVSCASPNDCLAVGTKEQSYTALSEHWDGEEWSIATLPDLEAEFGEEVEAEVLSGVSCASAQSCVAAGMVSLGEPEPGDLSAPYWALIERWNGSAWSLDPTATELAPKWSRFADVSCVSASYCVAVGLQWTAEFEFRPLAMEWDGEEWSLMTPATPAEHDGKVSLESVSCTSPSSCVAVGDYRVDGVITGLAEHWDGEEWSVVSTPAPEGAGTYGSILKVSCSGNDAASTRCLALNLSSVWRWDGETWSVIESPKPFGATWVNLVGVECSTEAACTLVGSYGSAYAPRPLAASWNGSEWSVQSTVAPSEEEEPEGKASFFHGVSCAPGICMATGEYWAYGGPEEKTLAERLAFPEAKTGAASSVNGSAATLSGEVNPSGFETNYHFEYGKTTSYGTKAPIPDKAVGSGTGDVEVSQAISGLNAGTTYHFRLVASNKVGTTYGVDQTFGTAGGPSFAFSFGSSGSGDGQLKGEFNRVAIDSSGNLWVVDQGNNRVQKFNSKGEYLSKFGSAGSGNGQFSGPAGIAIDSSGNIWVADSGNNRVQKFNSKGEYLSKFGSAGAANGQFNGPVGIAIDSSGNIWVVDQNNNRVQKFDSSGAYKSKFGTEGSTNGQLIAPSDVAIDSAGNLWVTDAYNNRVQKFDSSGAYKSKFGIEGTGNGQLKWPYGLGIDSAGNIWVADTSNNRVQKFNSSGEYVGQFGGTGSGEGQLNAPSDVTIDSAGDLWVADAGNHRVQKWTRGRPSATTGSASAMTFNTATLAGAVHPKGLATEYHFEYGKTTSYGTKAPIPDKAVGSGTGDVEVSQAISGLNAGTTYHFRLVASNAEGLAYGEDHTFKTAGPSFAFSFGSSGSGDGQFAGEFNRVAIDSSGNLWVVDSGHNRVQKFNSSGVYQSKFGSAGSGNGQFSGPAAIAIDSSGNLWVVDRGNNRVQKFNSKGEYLSKFGSAGATNGQFNEPVGIAIDSAGNIWVVDQSNNRVQKFDSSGAYKSKFGTEGWNNGQFIAPTDVAIDSAGNLWVTDAYNNRVQKFDSSGAYKSKFGAEGTGNGQLKWPYGLGIDSAGNIWVADTSNNRVQKFDSSGEYIGQFGEVGSGEGQLKSPKDVTIDSAGDLWVADATNHRVQKWLHE